MRHLHGLLVVLVMLLVSWGYADDSRVIVTVGKQSITQDQFDQYRQFLKIREPKISQEKWQTSEMKNILLEEMMAFYVQVNAADEEGIKVGENTVIESMVQLASSMGLTPKELYEYCEKNHLSYAYVRELIINLIKINDLHDRLFYQNATVSQKDVSDKIRKINRVAKNVRVDSIALDRVKYSFKDAKKIAKQWPLGYQPGVTVKKWEWQNLLDLPQYMHSQIIHLKSGQTSEVFQYQGKYHFIYLKNFEYRQLPHRNVVRRSIINERFVEWFKPWYSKLLSSTPIKWHSHAT